MFRDQPRHHKSGLEKIIYSHLIIRIYCMNCKPRIILEGETFNISECTCCQRIGLYYNNLLVGFNPQDFLAFTRSFCRIDFAASSVRFPSGKEHIVVNTCHRDIQFNFTREEFEELKDILQQAMVLLEARQVLKQNTI